MPYKVKALAALAGVSVRALHHYDQIGLLRPAMTTPAGYRLYTDRDLERLQQILFFKELGFDLREIKAILDRPDFDRRQALATQRGLLVKKKDRLEEMIRLVDETIFSIDGGKAMTDQEMFDAFDMSEIERHKREYADEARQRWGGTEAYKESERRTAKYTPKDWAVIQARQQATYRKIAALMDRAPADPEVQRAVGEWRQLITDYFYDCTLEIFRGLGEMYVNDPRFTKNIDKTKPGLAVFMRDAMRVYCNQAEGR